MEHLLASQSAVEQGAKKQNSKKPANAKAFMTSRNRSEGWTHAKFSGHALEEHLAAALVADARLSSDLHEQCFGSAETSHPEATAGGIDASHGKCVLGGVTPLKTDLVVRWNSGRVARISLKKSKGGQVWLVTPERFFAGFEKQFGRQVPEPVQQGLRLFIGPISQQEMRGSLQGRNPLGPIRKKDGISQEFHQERFVADTLKEIAPEAWTATVEWLRAEIAPVVELCFSRGLCAEPEAQAEFVWYYILNEESGELEESQVIPVSSIVRGVKALPPAKRAQVGPRNGGSTITLPFGFLQMHRPAGGNQMQFHHGLDAIKATLGLL